MKKLQTIEKPVLMVNKVVRNVQSALTVLNDLKCPDFLKVSAAKTSLEHIDIYVKTYTENAALTLLSENLPMAMQELPANVVLQKTPENNWVVSTISFNADTTAFLEPASGIFKNPMHAIVDFFEKEAKEETA
jgi:hypothetical protein